MKCPKCNGTGEANMSNGMFAWKVECDECCGGGVVAPLTEEEYIQSCDTEKLAEFIVNLTLLDKYKLYDRMEAAEYEQGIGIGAKKVIVKWLKEIHDDNL